MKIIRKFFKFAVTSASIYAILASIGNIQRGENMGISLLIAVASMLVLHYQAYKSGMLHESFYESEE